MRLRAIGVFVVALSTTGSAQWLTQPTPGLPRTPDGKPNLKAPTPRIDGKPDFTGVWTGSEEVPRPASVDLQPWVNDAAHRHAQNFYKERPMFRCLPSGPATFSQSTGGGVWKRIVQTPTLIVILNDDLTFRQIFIDGRVLETDPFPSWMGYSVGRWEGDTLVVDSFGFNDKTWINGRGVQHTEALRMTERYTRADVGHLKIDVSFVDPGAFYKPLSMTVNMTLGADTELLERVCESGSDHWTGTVTDLQNAAVSVTPDVLTRYVGVYTGFWAANPRKVDVALVDGRLLVHTDDDAESVPLTPLSEKLFQSTGPGGLAYEFVTDGKGPATDVVEIHVSGGYKYPRRR
jgi:hypothetical protein